MGHVKLHIPGPVEVSEKTFRAFCTPMIGHRSQAFKDLYAKIQPQLQQLLYTKQLVYISTSSAWGVMEGAIRNLVARKVLNHFVPATGKSSRQRPAEVLSERELDVLRLASQGLSNQDIADKLVLSLRTVQAHFSHIFNKLQVSSRTEAVVRALKEGWVTLDDVP